MLWLKTKIAKFLLRREYRKYRNSWNERGWENCWERQVYNWLMKRGLI